MAGSELNRPTHSPTSVYIFYSILLIDFCKKNFSFLLFCVVKYQPIELYIQGVVMINFILQGNSGSNQKRSLRTHCPIMIRVHTEGYYFCEESCRCDIATTKNAMNLYRCKSINLCMGRSLILSREEKVTSDYDLISVL